MSILKVTIKEELTINNVDTVEEHVRTIDTVTESSSRNVTIGTSEVELIKFGSTVGAGQYVNADVKYLRITHIPPATAGSERVTLRVYTVTDQKAYFVSIPEGGSFVLGNVSAMDAKDSGYVATDAISASNIETIKAVSTAASTSLNIFVVE